jgi:hypothetical protein
MNEVQHSHQAVRMIFTILEVWLALGIFFFLAWIWDDFHMKKVEKEMKIRCFIPFTAGRLKFPDGTHRADAFGIKLEPEDTLPQPGSKIRIFTGTQYENFTVKMCETLTVLATGDPEKGDEPSYQRSPEVYVLIEEALSDSLLFKIKQLYGGPMGFDPNRDPKGSNRVNMLKAGNPVSGKPRSNKHKRK